MGFLDVRNLDAVYDSAGEEIHALQGVEFSLKKGESLGIAGESACGKSTLGLSIMRMVQGRVSGTIMLDGESILGMDEKSYDEGVRWSKVSMIFQGAMSSLDPVFTIGEQFAEILSRHGFGGDYKKHIAGGLAAVGLDKDIHSKFPHELSGGMKQRAVIAMALLLKPALVIADEPTTALDVLIQAQIINLLKRLKKEGMSFVLITHDLAILSEIADKIGIMYGGQMVEFGAASEIYNNPRHPYTQALLESIPTIGGKKPRYIRGSPPSLARRATGCGFLDRCPEAMEKCRRDPPAVRTDSGYAKCWLYE